MRVRRGVGATTDTFPFTVNVQSAGSLDWHPPNTPDSWFATNTDTALTCAQMIAAGTDVSGTDCAAPAVLSKLPSWAIPAGIGLIVFMMFSGGGGRRR